MAHLWKLFLTSVPLSVSWFLHHPIPPGQHPRLQEGEADASAGEYDPVESPGGTERKQTLPASRLWKTEGGGRGRWKDTAPASLPAPKSACLPFPTLRQLLEGLASWAGAGDGRGRGWEGGGLLQALICHPGCRGKGSPFPPPNPSPILPPFRFVSLNLNP